MTIQIDDSGWGCPIGGVLIAGYRPETGEFHAATIPVEQFQGTAFASHSYLEAALIAARTVLIALQCEDGEPIEICSGYVHAKTRTWLAMTGRPWQTVKVEGRLQELIEQALADHLKGLGFEWNGSTEQYGSLFFSAIRWLKDGDINRAGMNPEKLKLAKTGWATFTFYERLPYEEAKIAAQQFKAQRRRRRWHSRYEDDD